MRQKLFVVAIAISVIVAAGCGAATSSRPPDVAAAQVSTDIVLAATTLQNEVNRLTAAGTLPIAAGQKLTDGDKVVFAKAQQLSAALKAYHAVTSVADKSAKAAEVQALITSLSAPLADMLGVKLPDGAAASVSRLIGSVMSAVGAIQSEVAKGLSGELFLPQLQVPA